MPVLAKNQKRLAGIGRTAVNMDKEEKDIELIESYFKEKLSEKDLKDFELRRSSDHAFNQKVEDYVLIMQSINDEGVDQFMGNLQNWEEDIRKSKSFSLNTFLKYAAIVLLIIIPTGLWYFGIMDASRSDKELFLAYYTPYEDILTQRSQTDNPDLMKGMAAYNAKDYQSALSSLENYLSDNENSMVQVYVAVCQISLNHPQAAVDHLEEVRKTAQGLPLELADWYMTLIHIDQGDHDKAVILLNNMVANDHIFASQAQEILSELK